MASRASKSITVDMLNHPGMLKIPEYPNQLVGGPIRIYWPRGYDDATVREATLNAINNLLPEEMTIEPALQAAKYEHTDVEEHSYVSLNSEQAKTLATAGVNIPGYRKIPTQTANEAQAAAEIFNQPGILKFPHADLKEDKRGPEHDTLQYQGNVEIIVPRDAYYGAKESKGWENENHFNNILQAAADCLSPNKKINMERKSYQANAFTEAEHPSVLISKEDAAILAAAGVEMPGQRSGRGAARGA